MAKSKITPITEDDLVNEHGTVKRNVAVSRKFKPLKSIVRFETKEHGSSGTAILNKDDIAVIDGMMIDVFRSKIGHDGLKYIANSAAAQGRFNSWSGALASSYVAAIVTKRPNRAGHDVVDYEFNNPKVKTPPGTWKKRRRGNKTKYAAVSQNGLIRGSYNKRYKRKDGTIVVKKYDKKAFRYMVTRGPLKERLHGYRDHWNINTVNPGWTNKGDGEVHIIVQNTAPYSGYMESGPGKKVLSGFDTKLKQSTRAVSDEAIEEISKRMSNKRSAERMLIEKKAKEKVEKELQKKIKKSAQNKKAYEKRKFGENSFFKNIFR